jgi:phosphoribosylaminoimidazole carboxylase PurE protein
MSQPIVGIIMGSQSDLEVMEPAAKALEEFGIPYDLRVLSAHRTPEAAFEYAKTARDRGLKVIIAGAGAAAHLAGVMAGLTTLPVVGVPILGKSLNGMDSLFSTVQMPPGVPVATVAINGSKNAALLAIRMLGIEDARLAAALDKFRVEQADAIAKANESVARTG